MARLPNFQSPDQPFQLLQSKWSAILNPVLINPMTNPTILKDIPIQSGVNVINTTLQKTQQGWCIIDITAPATLYRSAPFNDLTLTLTSSANTTISLAVW